LTFSEKQNSYLSGNLTRNVTKGDGWWYFRLNSTDLPSADDYTFIIQVEKDYYIDHNIEIDVNILEVPMELQPENGTDTFEMIWLENLTVKARLLDIYYTGGINDANLTFEEKQNGYVSGNLIRDITMGTGWYNFSFESTDLPKYGSYTFKIEAEKDNYVHQIIEIYVEIKQINTQINGSIYKNLPFTITVSTHYDFYFNYTDNLGNPITEAESGGWELQQVGDNTEIFSGSLINTTTPGIYEIYGLDTSFLEVGTYSIIIRLSKINYIERAAAISLVVNKIPIELVEDINGNIYSKSKGDDIYISLELFDPILDTPLDNAEVTITYENHTYKMNHTAGTGIYFYNIDTTGYDVLAADKTFQAVINIEVNENYTIGEIKITVQVLPPLGPLGIPLIYWIIVGAVSVAALSIFITSKVVSNARIPLMVKQINATSKKIKKNKRFGTLKITLNREEYLEDISVDSYEALGFSLKGKLTKKGKKLKDNSTNLNKTIAGSI
jgi:hypothetical protein